MPWFLQGRQVRKRKPFAMVSSRQDRSGRGSPLPWILQGRIGQEEDVLCYGFFKAGQVRKRFVCCLLLVA